MIVTRTPLRVSFAGGGTDIPAWYERGHPGAVVSAAINLYVYVNVNWHWRRDRTRLSYSVTETVDDLSHLQHEIARESIRECGFNGGLEITTIADVPGRGTGLGSSSSVTVGMIHALKVLSGRRPTKKKLAETACLVEIERLKKPIGKQDQYAVAYGGINYIEFLPAGKIKVERLKVNPKTIEEMNEKFILYYTGIHRRSADILTDQMENLGAPISGKAKIAEMQAMVGLASQAREALVDGRVLDLAYIVAEGWERKRKLSEKITNEKIDHWYEMALEAGAKGGKICGAGGGGFMLLYVPDVDTRWRVEDALKLREVRVKYGVEGSTCVLDDQEG